MIYKNTFSYLPGQPKNLIFYILKMNELTSFLGIDVRFYPVSHSYTQITPVTYEAEW